MGIVILSTILGTSGASLSRNLLTGKGAKYSNIPVRGVMKDGEGTIRAVKGTNRINRTGFLMPPHPNL